MPPLRRDVKCSWLYLDWKNMRRKCQIYNLLHFTQLKNEDFKKIGKLQGKTIRIINFLPLNAPVDKQKYEINILKLRDFIMLWNVLFVKGCLNGNAPGSFNDKFHSSKLRLTHTRSSSAYQLKVIYFGLTIYCYEICSHTFIHSFNSIDCNGDSCSFYNFILSLFFQNSLFLNFL